MGSTEHLAFRGQLHSVKTFMYQGHGISELKRVIYFCLFGSFLKDKQGDSKMELNTDVFSKPLNDLKEFFIQAWNQGAAISWGWGGNKNDGSDDGLNEPNSMFCANINGEKITAIRDNNVIRFAKDGRLFSAATSGVNPINNKQWKRMFVPIGKNGKV